MVPVPDTLAWLIRNQMFACKARTSHDSSLPLISLIVAPRCSYETDMIPSVSYEYEFSLGEGGSGPVTEGSGDGDYKCYPSSVSTRILQWLKPLLNALISST